MTLTCSLGHLSLRRSGKSTLIGVLSSAGLDDGRGAARSLVLRHRHEQENGRTSAVTMEIMGYSKDGQQVQSISSSSYSKGVFIRRVYDSF